MRLFFLVILISSNLFSQIIFHDYFLNKSLRIDYYHTGDDKNDYYSIDELKEEPFWGGSQVNLVDTFQYGKYKVEIYDSLTNQLLYSRGYSTLFSEWQTTKEAKSTTKSFSETVLVPFPQKTIKAVFFTRDSQNIFHNKFEYFINPSNYFISPERHKKFNVFDVHVSGDPSKKLDIVIIPDGYRKEEMDSFKLDCQKFTRYLFETSPYKENQDKINIRGVEAASEESGTDIPKENIWKNTILNTRYYTFNLERYLMTDDNKAVRDVAANAPYDQIYILVKSNGYGGGSIYNHYSVCVNNNEYAEYIFTHEFGHGFAGLGDEYYDSEVAYESFYPSNVEPWEPNLTTLVNFDQKWKDMIKKGIPIPTPALEKYKTTVGVFEGGGYESKGVYRPMIDCSMKSISVNNFCPVCRRAIQKMIDFYSN